MSAKYYINWWRNYQLISFQDIPDDVFDLYCWIHSSYTIPRALSLHVGRDVAHPGVMTSAHDQEDERRYVTYYQWVGFTLFFQAILFYIPRWLWKNWEAGKITALMMDLDVGVVSEVSSQSYSYFLLEKKKLSKKNWWSYPRHNGARMNPLIMFLTLLSSGGEETEKEIVAGLSLRQFEESQLVGLQILLLWTVSSS